MALDRAQRHFKIVTARNLHFVVTLFVEEVTKIVSEISLTIFVNSNFQEIPKTLVGLEDVIPLKTFLLVEWH